MHAFHRERICDTIVFFGSARLAPDGPLGRYYDDARELARRVAAWSESLPADAHRYVVCTGGGGGHHGGREPRRSGRRRQDDRPQHRIAAGAAARTPISRES